MAATLAGGPSAQAPPVFRAVAESVYLDVFATRDGEPVPGLTALDFEVLDGGRRVPVELIPTAAVPLSAVLVLDTSLSVSGSKLDHLRKACDAFVRGLGPRDEALLLTFSNAVRLRADAGLRFDSGDTAPGWRSLEVRLKHKHADLRHRPGYTRLP